jgi:hypothetical protein
MRIRIMITYCGTILHTSLKIRVGRAAQLRRAFTVPRVRARRRLLAAILLAGSAAATPADFQPPALSISDKSFHCMTEMTHIGHFYVDNLVGNLKGTVQVAESMTSGLYPVGSVLQLVPTEVMVKREKGFNAATHDWEFFELGVSPNGSTIQKRGFVEVVNRFGGNCFACHIRARPEWDLVCDTTHGCESIPITIAMINALQRTDPRCKKQGPVSPEDAAALEQLAVVQKAMAAANAAEKPHAGPSTKN